VHAFIPNQNIQIKGLERAGAIEAKQKTHIQQIPVMKN
jgi:hypothetical protein